MILLYFLVVIILFFKEHEVQHKGSSKNQNLKIEKQIKLEKKRHKREA